MAKKNDVVVNMLKERETKNMIRFAEEKVRGYEAAIGTLYLRKDRWTELGEPIEITVTVTSA